MEDIRYWILDVGYYASFEDIEYWMLGVGCCASLEDIEYWILDVGCYASLEAEIYRLDISTLPVKKMSA